MPRPIKCRHIHSLPDITYYKPRGVPMRELNEVYLPVEGMEAMRLTDLEGLSQQQAAARMQVSRQTFGRILAQARRTVTRALASGMALRIHGGHYALQAGARADLGCAEADEGPGAEASCDSVPEPRETVIDKIAISSEGPGLDDMLDPRFGRAAGFVIVDPRTMASDYVDNGSSQAMAQGAGLRAAEIVAAKGAKAVLTGFVGSKAFMALQEAGIRVGQNLENMSVRQAVERFNKGLVEWAAAPNRQGRDRPPRHPAPRKSS